METDAQDVPCCGPTSLETFLSGMETCFFLPSFFERFPLETFLSGMETLRRGDAARRRHSLKPSLVEWKLRTIFAPSSRNMP